jgi:hypothetical protein
MIGMDNISSSDIHFDFTHVIFVAAKFSSAPKKIHCNVVRKILKYLKATSSFGICFIRDGDVNILTTYCDVNYIADLDDCRSKISFFCS